MTAHLPAPASRALALAILLGILALGWFGAVQPVLGELSATRQQIEQTRDLLARYQAINAGRPELEEELERRLADQTGAIPWTDL